ncbi:SDR family oxidoreductase [Streptomyces morookaense]|uniref:SDR family NAD(P)-dependent oxidoreductase n=1 Tax=Streptomyces morookaense TaxID=1970 RepID=A0A7Y7EAC1_STRMO|nr:SDR family oxidoreductase [Streptomyces morookaense]NVK81933.1 SDR family NAD(P)-dependent oxidoreductase [Streptomyces morookaense]GHF22672.1 short-chain dehydrogenase [Streptomyces morookaense]
MTGICAGQVAVVTGAGRGLGRAHALALAAEGARVVVNDLGTDRAGEGSSTEPAREVVREIRDRGGEAVAHAGDVATGEGAASLVATALDAFGRLDVLVNNAGFLRDRMLVSLGEDDWDAVVRVHLKGHFLPMRCAAAHWRAESKAGRAVRASIVNTTSGAGLLGSVGQANYAAAKAGIVALTLVAAAELARYGVRANAVAPAARTRMTEGIFGDGLGEPGDVSPLVVWLGSQASADVTGRVFEAEGGRITVMEGWRRGPTADGGGRWTPTEAGGAARRLLTGARAPGPVYGAGAP